VDMIVLNDFLRAKFRYEGITFKEEYLYIKKLKKRVYYESLKKLELIQTPPTFWEKLTSFGSNSGGISFGVFGKDYVDSKTFDTPPKHFNLIIRIENDSSIEFTCRSSDQISLQKGVDKINEQLN